MISFEESGQGDCHSPLSFCAVLYMRVSEYWLINVTIKDISVIHGTYSDVQAD